MNHFVVYLEPCKSRQLQTDTCQEHLPVKEQQQQCFLTASMETEPCAAAGANLQHPLRGVQCGERGMLSSRETDGTGL